MNRAAVLILVLLLASGPASASIDTLQEDFESYPVIDGVDDIDVFDGVWHRVEGGNPTRFTSKVIDGGLDGTAQTLEIPNSTAHNGFNTAGNRAWFHFEPTQVSRISFYAFCTGSSPSKPFFFGLQSGDGPNAAISLRLLATTGTNGCQVTHPTPAGSAVCDDTLGSVGPAATQIEVFVEAFFDWSAKTYNITLYDATTGDVIGNEVAGFCDADVESFDRFTFFGTSTGGGGTLKIDQILINDGNPAIVAPLEPSEFDSGLAAILISMGIVTPESQMFFVILLVALILAGLTAALRWTSPGRLKNAILAGVAMLSILLMAFFNYIEEWMVIVTIAIGAFVTLGGAKVVQNTYFETRDKLLSLAGIDPGGETVTDTTVASDAGPGDES